MHARVSTFQGPPDRIDEGLRAGREEIIPAVKEMAGFKGVFFLVDRQSGKTMSVTLWEDDSAMRESEERANQLRQKAAESEDATIQSVERYEVGLWEMG